MAVVWLLEITGHSSDLCFRDKLKKKVNVKVKVGIKGPTEIQWGRCSFSFSSTVERNWMGNC